MTSLPQGMTLQEIHRAFLERDSDLKRQILELKNNLGKTVATTVARSISPSSGGSSSGSSGSGVTPEEETVSEVTFLSIRTIAIDETDGLPATDSEDCAIFELVTIPVLSGSTDRMLVTIPTWGGTFYWNCPTDVLENTFYVEMAGEHHVEARCEISTNGFSIALYNNSDTTGNSTVVTVALSGTSDVGIAVPVGEIVYVKANSTSTALELVYG